MLFKYCILPGEICEGTGSVKTINLTVSEEMFVEMDKFKN